MTTQQSSDSSFTKRILAWIQAARLPAQSNIFFPLLLGQSFLFLEGKSLSWGQFLWVFFYGIALQLYIVFANDWADQETDAKNETYTIFSGGSRVLAAGKLTPESIRNAAILMAGLSLLLSLFLSWVQKSFLIFDLCLLSLLLLHMYSYSPLRLSYRGGGEFLQALGIGVILPIFGYLNQGGAFSKFPFAFLPAFFALQLGGSIATSLPDEPSDRISLKKTFAVQYGLQSAKIFLMLSLFLGILGSIAWLSSLGVGIFYRFAFPGSVFLFLTLFFSGRPGERKLSFFVFFSLLCLFSVEGILVYSLWEQSNLGSFFSF